MNLSLRLLLLVLAAIVPAHVRAGVVPSVFGGKLPCVEQASGVQFCAGTLPTRIETWDGVPLDVNLTLPPAAVAGPYPLIVDIHGWNAQGTCWQTSYGFVTRNSPGQLLGKK